MRFSVVALLCIGTAALHMKQESTVLLPTAVVRSRYQKAFFESRLMPEAMIGLATENPWNDRQIATGLHADHVDLKCPSPDCALAAFAKRHQCPSAEAPMPCFDASAHKLPAIHLHTPKMAGRTLRELGPDLFDLPFCKLDGTYGPYSHRDDVGEREEFIKALERHRDEMMQDPCFVSYEGGWDMVTKGFGNSTPIVMTMLREPISWTISAIVHDETHRRNEGIDDAVERCFVERDNCHGFLKPPVRVNNDTINMGLELAKFRLSTSLFGVVEHMTESLCLFDFQLGKEINRTLCDCTSAVARGDVQQVGKRDYAKEKLMRPDTLEIVMQEAASWLYTRLYAFALELFYKRVDVFEKETSMKLFCYD